MAWLISFQGREAYNGSHGLAYGPPEDDITVSDFHPVAYVGHCASDVLELKKEIERNPGTNMRMMRVTRIHFVMEIPEDLRHLECIADVDGDLDAAEDEN